MRKTLTFAFIFLSIFIVNAEARTQVVSRDVACTAGTLYPTIQAAVDDAREGRGDIVTVCPGTYIENVVINKAIPIGAYSGGLSTVVSAQNNSKPVFDITVSSVTISGFTIKNSLDSGIRLDAAPLNISFNNFINNVFAIYVNTPNTGMPFFLDPNYFGTRNCEIIISEIYDYEDDPSKNKILFQPYLLDPYPNITSGSCPFPPPSVSIQSPQNTTYNINAVDLNFTVSAGSPPYTWMGYSLDGQSIITINGNVTLTDLADGSHNVRVYAYDSFDYNASSIVYFTIKSGCGILSNPSFTYTLTNDISYGGDQTCLDLQADNIILDCNYHTISATLPPSSFNFNKGIRIGGKNSIVKNCFVTNFYDGILSENILNTITNNVLYGINYYGIRTRSSNNTIYNNIIRDNSFNAHGLSIESAYNLIYNNTAYNNRAGSRFEGGSYNIFVNNTFYNNNWYAMAIYGAGSNIISSNDFHDNQEVFRFYGFSNGNNFTENTIIRNVIGFNNNVDDFSIYDNNNYIHDNLFINNSVNAQDVGNNYWNISKTAGTNILGGPFLGGNFWSDYSGYDVNGDGLGDVNIPHNSSGGISNGGDFAPLTEPNLDITPPTVTIISPSSTYYKINISLIFTVDEPISWSGYSLDENTTVTITGETNLTVKLVGNHNVTVFATDLAGNMGSSMHTFISCVGDLDRNNKITILDIARASFAFDTQPGYTHWDPDSDLDEDGRISILDIMITAYNFDKTC